MTSMFSSLASWLRMPLEAVGVVSPDYNTLTDQERELLKFLQREIRDEKPVYKELKGFVTQLSSNSIELDHKFIYELGANDRFGIGDRVAYKVFKLAGDCVVKDVVLLVEKNKLVTKTVSSTIVKVEGSSYELSNQATFDLKKVRAEFLPILNDLVTLEGDYPKDRGEEFDMDFSQFNIVRVTPTKTKLITGSITEWSPESLTGVIGKEVCFHQNVCDKLAPKIGDMVVCNAIEGRYDNGFKWRAESVALNTSSQTVQRHFKLFVAHVPSFTLVVGQSKTLELCLSNHSNMMLVIKEASATSNNADPQLEMKEQAPVIPPGSFISWSVEVFGTKIGTAKAWIKWGVDCGRSRFIAKSSISYVVVPQNFLGESNGKPSDMKGWTQPRKIPHLIPGQARLRNPVFRRVPLKDYAVPHIIRKLSEGLEENKELIEMQIQLQRKFPSLAEGLNLKNYGEWMHTMLFLEEVSDEASYKKLSTQAHLYTSRQFIVFNFPIDSEYSKIVCGDSMLVSKPWDASLCFEGKVWETSASQLFCKFNPDFEQTIRAGALYDIVFKMSRSSYRRCHQAVDLVLDKIGGEWLFPAVSPDENLEDCGVENDDDLDLGVFRSINKSVNQQQSRAVRNILTNKNLPYPYIIYGPPGTGKTLTVIELILQVYTRVPECRILVAAPTNSAVDTLGVRLLGFGVLKKEDMVRLSGFNAYSQGQIATQLMDVSYVPNLGGPSSETFVPGDRDPPPILYTNDIGKHKITVGTLSTLAVLNNAGLPQGYFTHIVIDEAGQCHEPETLLPAALVDPKKTQLVLAGDPMQLGPTITSMLARQYHFHRPLLDRFSSSYVYRKKFDAFERTSGYNPRLITRLIYNYRSLPKLVNMVGELFYENDLLSIISGNKSPEADTLRKLEINGFKLSTGMNSLVFINVDSKDEQIDGSHSWYNSGEVLQVMYALNSLYAKGISPDDIGVITPYTLQVRKIYELLDSLKIFSPKVGSVEEFQGQERDIVIISLVRNNLGLSKKLTPFLTDAQRINVALSRARILSMIIGNRKTLSAHPMWANIISRCHVMNFVNLPENGETS